MNVPFRSIIFLVLSFFLMEIGNVVFGCTSKRISCISETTFKFCFTVGNRTMEIGNLKHCPSHTICSETEGNIPCIEETIKTSAEPAAMDFRKESNTVFVTSEGEITTDISDTSQNVKGTLLSTEVKNTYPKETTSPTIQLTSLTQLDTPTENTTQDNPLIWMGMITHPIKVSTDITATVETPLELSDEMEVEKPISFEDINTVWEATTNKVTTSAVINTADNVKTSVFTTKIPINEYLKKLTTLRPQKNTTIAVEKLLTIPMVSITEKPMPTEVVRDWSTETQRIIINPVTTPVAAYFKEVSTEPERIISESTKTTEQNVYTKETTTNQPQKLATVSLASTKHMCTTLENLAPVISTTEKLMPTEEGIRVWSSETHKVVTNSVVSTRVTPFKEISIGSDGITSAATKTTEKSVYTIETTTNQPQKTATVSTATSEHRTTPLKMVTEKLIIPVISATEKLMPTEEIKVWPAETPQKVITKPVTSTMATSFKDVLPGTEGINSLATKMTEKSVYTKETTTNQPQKIAISVGSTKHMTTPLKMSTTEKLIIPTEKLMPIEEEIKVWPADTHRVTTKPVISALITSFKQVSTRKMTEKNVYTKETTTIQPQKITTVSMDSTESMINPFEKSTTDKLIIPGISTKEKQMPTEEETRVWLAETPSVTPTPLTSTVAAVEPFKKVSTGTERITIPITTTEKCMSREEIYENILKDTEKISSTSDPAVSDTGVEAFLKRNGLVTTAEMIFTSTQKATTVIKEPLTTTKIPDISIEYPKLQSIILFLASLIPYNAPITEGIINTTENTNHLEGHYSKNNYFSRDDASTVKSTTLENPPTNIRSETVATSDVTTTSLGPPRTCTRTGRYPSLFCNVYYECVKVMWWYQLEVKSCFDGEAFHHEKLSCIPSNDCFAT